MKHYLIADCNNCVNINVTEDEQKAGDNHICRQYDRRVFHRASIQPHSPQLYPCQECLKDEYLHYDER